MMNQVKKSSAPSGMTLMEVVIALSVIAFAIPLILAAIGSANDTRGRAEADTRSAWLAREVEREIVSSWADPAPESAFGTPLTFPEFATAADPEILAYDSEGNFLEKGVSADLSSPSKTPKAAYLVAVHGETHRPLNIDTSPDSLSLLTIRVLHPAKAPAATRSDLRYHIISPRQGTL